MIHPFNENKKPIIVLNKLLSTSMVSDYIYKSPTYSIYHEEINSLGFIHTLISYYPLISSTERKITCAEIDGISLVHYSNVDKYLFKELKERGYTSTLILNLMSLEETCSILKDPCDDNILFTRVSRKVETPTGVTTRYRYYLHNGNVTFQYIEKIDPDFWGVIAQAMLETDIFEISGIDLAVDWNIDLMPIISNCIRKGHYESSGLKPYGFYSLDNTRRKSSLGKRSKEYNELKDLEFLIDSLYFGQSLEEIIRILIYNKMKEERERKNVILDPTTRIELKLNLSKMNPPTAKELASELLRSYKNYDGFQVRNKHFVEMLTYKLRFSNHYHNHGIDDLALWWRTEVIDPLYSSFCITTEELMNNNEKKKNEATSMNLLPDGKRKRGRPKGSLDKTKRKSTRSL